ncbi:LytR/AlgR family response regulator transcription factor [Pelosinus sp. sgz500959]|uniref:LytR/AlgR family response regulator transcription factor n=1 Tax=Pelosinus sp. sgz500959 TaxID=3242472 RepID=UPI00366E061B
MLRILSVDDESPARDELKYLLSLENEVEVIGEADSGAAAITMAAQLKPNVIFLDVQMRGMNGLETASVLRTVVPETLIVFATAYDEYAVRAFEVGAVDYILKPFESHRIHTTVERLKNYHPDEWLEAVGRIDTALSKTKIIIKKLPLEKNGKIIMVHYQDLIYAYTQKGLVNVVTMVGEFVYGGTLTDLEVRLAHTNLVRVHKSYIVNMDRVKEVVPWFKGTYWLKVEGDHEAEIPVSKSQIKEIKEMLGLK